MRWKLMWNLKQAKVIKILNKYSDYFVSSERKRSGVAILHSDRMNMFHCAHQKTGCYVGSCYEESMKYIYRDFLDNGYSVDFVKAEHLGENPLGVKCLVIPEYDYMMSESEKKLVDEFHNKGGKVFAYSLGSYNEYGRVGESILSEENNGGRTFREMTEMARISPLYVNHVNNLKIKIIESEDFYVVSLNNISTFADKTECGEIKFNFDISRAVIVTLEGEAEAEVTNCTVKVPPIESAAMIIAYK